VVLVEDLVTTGDSSITAVEALRAEGAVVSDCLAIISYGFPEAVERFERASIRLHAATTFQAVLESAITSKMIDAAGAAVVRDWLEEPRLWAKRYGFE
jgi:orotate phosphoribosyltransferase